MRRSPMPRRTTRLARSRAERGREEARARLRGQRQAALKRKPMRVTTPRHGSRREAEKRLKAVNAPLVKARDGYECVQCRADGVRLCDILEAGHLYPRSSFPAGKYVLENIHCQCRLHNQRHIRRPEYFMNWHIAAVGQEAHDRLHFLVTGESPSTETLWLWVEEREALLEQIRMDEMVAA